MFVNKRNGIQQKVSFDKVLRRLETLCQEGSLDNVNVPKVGQTVISQIYDGVTSEEIDNLAATICASMATTHPDYDSLAGRILVSNLHKNLRGLSFIDATRKLHEAGILSQEYFDTVMRNSEYLNGIVESSRDYLIDTFGFKTLLKSYLIKVNGQVIETPQFLFLRVATAIHGDDLESVKETYDMMSRLRAVHATPTLFNAGTKSEQLASCFLVANADDSIEGIFDTVKAMALISKRAGGLGVHMSNVRARGSRIQSTNGVSSGLLPFMRIQNATCRAVDQSGRRPAGCAIYLEPWHADVLDFIQIRKPHGDAEQRCRDLFPAMWCPDLFFKRVIEKGQWSLFCPNECPGLQDAYGDDFVSLYELYEAQGKAKVTMPAMDLFKRIMESQIESGTPYMLNKDQANIKSNQKNLGTIKSSNLCAEIIEYSDKNETAVCNLASIALPKAVVKNQETGEMEVDHEYLAKIAGILTKNLNRVIDKTFYPTEQTSYSNFKHRPIGVGVQGLADMYALLRLPFDSKEAEKVNKEVFESIYYGCMRSSIELAEKYGPYESFKGSPLSEGKFQFDLWGTRSDQLSGRWDWDTLRNRVTTFGARNSLCVALMPTASTSMILGNSECFEPFTSNVYSRSTLSGDHIVVNKHLIRDLVELGIWSPALKDKLIHENGSVQNIPEIPDDIKCIYRTAWDIDPISMVRQCAGRGPFVCQSQSFNLYVAEPNFNNLSRAIFAGYKLGLKTLSYYLRSKPKSSTVKFTASQQTPDCVMCSA